MRQVQAVRLNMLSGFSGSSSESQPSEDETTPLAASFQTLWKQCLALLEKELPHHTFQAWIHPIVPLSCIDNILLLRVPSRFFLEWIETNHLDLLKRVVSGVFNTDLKIDFSVIPTAEVNPEWSEKDELQEEPEIEWSSKPNPIQPACDVNHQNQFISFFCGKENQLALKSAEFVAKNLARVGYNPLFLYGDSGAGKTHLLHAIGNYALEHYPDMSFVSMRSERFLQEYVSAVRNGGMPKFLKPLLSARLFLLDNLQFLASKMRSQEILLYILSELLQRDAQVVVNSDIPPARLKQFNPALISLLQKGLIVNVITGDYSAREQFIHYHLRKNEIRLDEDIIHFLAENLAQNMNDLNSVLTRIIAQISLLERKLNLTEVKRIVSHMCPQVDVGQNIAFSPKGIGIHEIVNATAEYFEIPVDILQGVSRKRRILKARQIAIYLCRELTGDSLSSIGYHFSNLHHSSVIYSCNKIKQELQEHSRLRSTVQKIRALLL